MVNEQAAAATHGGNAPRRTKSYARKSTNRMAPQKQLASETPGLTRAQVRDTSCTRQHFSPSLRLITCLVVEPSYLLMCLSNALITSQRNIFLDSWRYQTFQIEAVCPKVDEPHGPSKAARHEGSPETSTTCDLPHRNVVK